MYVVVTFDKGLPVGVLSAAGKDFIICQLFKEEATAQRYGASVRQMLGQSFKIFKEIAS